MPTYEELARFRRQFEKLPKSAQAAFLNVVRLFVAFLNEHGFDPTQAPRGLRLHKLSGHDAWSISFGDGMRAVFRLGVLADRRSRRSPIGKDGEVHVVWEFIGTHDEYERIYYPGGLSISPGIFEHVANPGSVGSIKISNTTGKSMAVRVALRPWLQSRSGEVSPNRGRMLGLR